MTDATRPGGGERAAPGDGHHPGPAPGGPPHPGPNGGPGAAAPAGTTTEATGPAAPAPDEVAAPGDGVSYAELIDLLDAATAERDANLEARARLQAEFENYKKRVAKQELDQVARANEALVTKLLPTLDAFDAALAHGQDGVEPLQQNLLGTLEREGLAKLVPTGEAFDPNSHEAVLHEAGDADEEHGVVVEVLRAGYAWKGRVIRPAMVKVRT